MLTRGKVSSRVTRGFPSQDPVGKAYQDRFGWAVESALYSWLNTNVIVDGSAFGLLGSGICEATYTLTPLNAEVSLDVGFARAGLRGPLAWDLVRAMVAGIVGEYSCRGVVSGVGSGTYTGYLQGSLSALEEIVEMSLLGYDFKGESMPILKRGLAYGLYGCFTGIVNGVVVGAPTQGSGSSPSQLKFY